MVIMKRLIMKKRKFEEIRLLIRKAHDLLEDIYKGENSKGEIMKSRLWATYSECSNEILRLKIKIDKLSKNETKKKKRKPVKT
ncbi:MAG: hypothetical protein KKD44_26740 [Proteobacteria bacterium]|nr:hypothetical protein [Pseudomonadota bacterium]